MKYRYLVKITDIKGWIIKIIFCAILWYKEIVQYKYYSGGKIFFILGIMLSIMVFADYITTYKKEESIRIPKAAAYISLYVILTYFFGYVSSPLLYLHKNHGITIIEFCVIMLFVCYYGDTRKSVNFLVYNYVAIYSFMVISFLISPVPIKSGGGIRYSFSSSLNPNSFAVGLATGIWAILYLISQKKIKFIVGFPLCGIMMYAIFLSGSRKGFLGSLIVIILWFLLYYIPLSENKYSKSKFLKIFVTVASVFIMILILLPYFNNSSMTSRIQNIFLDDSYIARTNMYKMGIRYLKNSPLLGYGFWGFAYFYGVYSHSTIIEVLVSSGIPIAIIYFLSYFIIIYNLFSLNKNGKQMNKNDLIIIRQFIILFIMEVFYTVCIIHIYNLVSYVNFGMIIMSYTLCIKKKENRNRRGSL